MTRLVAEVGTCQGGDDAWIAESIERCAEAGIWGYKIQLYRPDWLVTPDAPTYGRSDFIKEPATQYEHFAKPFPVGKVRQTADLCRKHGLEFFASVFDESMIPVCEDAGVNIYKIASADITHKPLIQEIANTGKIIFLSTGASNLAEIRIANEWIAEASPHKGKAKCVLFVCSLAYPTLDEEAKLDVLSWAVQMFTPLGGLVGYSDHTNGLDVPVAAKALGAKYIEKHVTITPGRGGDHDFAVTPEQLSLVNHLLPDEDVAEVQPSLPYVTDAELSALKFARRSVCSVVDIPRKSLIRASQLRVLRPGTGIPPAWLDDPTNTPVGKKAAVDIPAFTPISPDMFGFVSASLTVE